MRKFFTIILLLTCMAFVYTSIYAGTTNLLPKKENMSSYTKNLPSGDLGSHFLPRLIDIMLKLSYTVSVAAVAYAGFTYISAEGDETATQKAKNILIYGVVGFLVATIAYAIVEGVMRFNFFS